jgi:hypothetical protein
VYTELILKFYALIKVPSHFFVKSTFASPSFTYTIFVDSIIAIAAPACTIAPLSDRSGPNEKASQ